MYSQLDNASTTIVRARRKHMLSNNGLFIRSLLWCSIALIYIVLSHPIVTFDHILLYHQKVKMQFLQWIWNACLEDLSTSIFTKISRVKMDSSKLLSVFVVKVHGLLQYSIYSLLRRCDIKTLILLTSFPDLFEINWLKNLQMKVESLR